MIEMRRVHQTKIVTIIALVIAVGVMTIGFAAFSNTLTISSSAIVTPDESEFLLKMYGFTGETEEEAYDFEKYTSETSSNMFMAEEDSLIFIDKTASLDNSSLSLSLGEVELKNPGNSIEVLAKIKNDGKYDVYFDSAQLSNYFSSGECVPGDGTSVALVEEVCSYIYRGIAIYNEQSWLETQKYRNGTTSNEDFENVTQQDCFYNTTMGNGNGICKLAKGEQVMLVVGVFYISSFSDDVDTTPRADGPFTVTFPDLELKFTSNATSVVTE